MVVTPNQETEQLPDEEDGVDVTEVVRVGIDIFFTLLSAYVFWTYAKERPEYQVAATRVREWWHKVTTATANVRQAERETVFEAIMIVGDD
jgi:hypothetical protein